MPRPRSPRRCTRQASADGSMLRSFSGSPAASNPSTSTTPSNASRFSGRAGSLSGRLLRRVLPTLSWLDSCQVSPARSVAASTSTAGLDHSNGSPRVLIRASQLGAGRTVETQLLDLLLLGELWFPPRLGASGPDAPQRVVKLASELVVLSEAVLGTATFDHHVLQPVGRIMAAFPGRVLEI